MPSGRIRRRPIQVQPARCSTCGTPRPSTKELISKLRANAELVRNYLTTDRRLFEEREASDHRMPHATNPYGYDYQAFVEQVGRDIMQVRTIRAWHYTRLSARLSGSTERS
jgi:hypothetical protein